jgi:hypothetical protein
MTVCRVVGALLFVDFALEQAAPVSPRTTTQRMASHRGRTVRFMYFPFDGPAQQRVMGFA